jgi:N utilization substance protein B
MTPTSKQKPAADGQRRRSNARLAAVQALYQMDLAGTDAAEVIDQFAKERLGVGQAEPKADEAGSVEDADPTFFAELVRGVVRRQVEIDPLIDRQLATGWRLTRIDSTLRAILRAGVFEIMHRPDVPPRVAISEYINVAHAFFDADEPRVVNGVLDAIARQQRGEELASGRGSG